VTGSLPSPLAGVFGGGGLFGIGYALGVIDGLRERGINLTGCPMLGTSAGSWAAAATALSVPFENLVDLVIPRFPNPRAGVLAASARAAFGEATDSHVRVVVTQIPRLKRVVLHGADYPLADLVAASSSVPGLLAPHSVGEKRYVDGGVRSGVSVDLADPASLLVVIAPLAGAMFGPFGRFVDSRTDTEQRRWSSHNQGRFLEFSPRRETALLASNPKHLFDKTRAIDAYHHGRAEAAIRTIE
jgi:predicted acylesterase/phospholipase RssA